MHKLEARPQLDSFATKYNCIHNQPPPPMFPPAIAAYAAHATTSSRFPVLQPRFDKLLAAQVANISEADRAKARSIAEPIAHALIIERCPTALASVDYLQR